MDTHHGHTGVEGDSKQNTLTELLGAAGGSAGGAAAVVLLELLGGLLGVRLCLVGLGERERESAGEGE